VRIASGNVTGPDSGTNPRSAKRHALPQHLADRHHLPDRPHHPERHDLADRYHLPQRHDLADTGPTGHREPQRVREPHPFHQP